MTIFNDKSFTFSFGNLHIFEEFRIYEYFRRILDLKKNAYIHLWSIFRNRRIFVFVFGPFSIFVATLVKIPIPTRLLSWQMMMFAFSLFQAVDVFSKESWKGLRGFIQYVNLIKFQKQNNSSVWTINCKSRVQKKNLEFSRFSG